MVWSRQLSDKLGMDEEDFVKALIKALTSEKVQRCLKQSICGEILKELHDLTEIVKKKEQKINELTDKVLILEDKCDDLEQYSRRNSLRVSGVEEQPFEDVTKVTLGLIRQDLGKKEFPISAIDRIHRVGRKRENGTPRPILVKFATYRDRAQVFQLRTRLRNNEAKKGPTYINEDLTQKRASLLYQARKLKKALKISDCWSSDGQILVKNNSGKILVIKSVNDLLKFDNEPPVPRPPPSRSLRDPTEPWTHSHHSPSAD